VTRSLLEDVIKVSQFAEIDASGTRQRGNRDLLDIYYDDDMIDAFVKDTNSHIAAKVANGALSHEQFNGYTLADGTKATKIRSVFKDVNKCDILAFTVNYAAQQLGMPVLVGSPTRFEFLRANVCIDHTTFVQLFADATLALVQPGNVVATDDILYRALGLKDVGILISSKPAQFGLYMDGQANLLLHSELPVYIGLKPHLDTGNKYTPWRANNELMRELNEKVDASLVDVSDKGYGSWELVDANAALSPPVATICAINPDQLDSDLAELMALNLPTNCSRVYEVVSPKGQPALVGAFRCNESSVLYVVSTAHRLKSAPAGVETSKTLIANALKQVSALDPFVRTMLADRFGLALPPGGGIFEAAALLSVDPEDAIVQPTLAASSSSSSSSSPSTTLSATIDAAARRAVAEVRREAASATVTTRHTAAARPDLSEDELQKLSNDELKIMAKVRKIKVRRAPGRSAASSLVKSDYVRALMRSQDAAAADDDGATVAALTKASTKGMSPLHVGYKKYFNALDRADQYKAEITTMQRRHGSSPHVATLHFILAIWTNMYSISQEKEAIAKGARFKRMPIKEWLRSAVKELANELNNE